MRMNSFLFFFIIIINVFYDWKTKVKKLYGQCFYLFYFFLLIMQSHNEQVGLRTWGELFRTSKNLLHVMATKCEKVSFLGPCRGLIEGSCVQQNVKKSTFFNFRVIFVILSSFWRTMTFKVQVTVPTVHPQQRGPKTSETSSLGYRIAILFPRWGAEKWKQQASTTYTYFRL